jgi:hypothetical protein
MEYDSIREAKLSKDFHTVFDVLGTPIYHERMSDFLTPCLRILNNDVKELQAEKSQYNLSISLCELEKIISLIAGGFHINIEN